MGESISYTLEQVAELTGFSVDALVRGARRAERGEPSGIPHSKFAGVRVMTRSQIEELLAHTEIRPELTEEQRDADELERRRDAARRRVANRLTKGRAA